MTIKVNKVEVTNPPITAHAIGALKDALSPKPKVSGSNAKTVVKLVIRIGK